MLPNLLFYNNSCWTTFLYLYISLLFFIKTFIWKQMAADVFFEMFFVLLPLNMMHAQHIC